MKMNWIMLSVALLQFSLIPLAAQENYSKPTPPVGSELAATAKNPSRDLSTPFTDNFNTHYTGNSGFSADWIPGTPWFWSHDTVYNAAALHYTAAWFGETSALCSVPITITSQMPRLLFKWSKYHPQYYGDIGSVKIYVNYSATPITIWQLSGNDFASNDGAGMNNPGSYVQESLDLQPYHLQPGMIVQIMFEGTSGAIYSPTTWFVDDVSVLSVDSSISVFPHTQTFAATAFPPTYWANPHSWEAPALNPWIRGDANAYGATGTGSALCSFANHTAGRVLELKTPYLNLGSYGGYLTYDYAYSAYSGATAYDQLQIQYSTDMGITFGNLATYDGSPEGGMATAPAHSTGPWNPSGSQWASRTLFLPPGTNMLKFRGVSAYSGRLFIDNVKLEKKYFASGTGIQADPFTISNAQELNLIRNYLGSASARTYFKLTADINLTSFLEPGGEGFAAWGTNGWLPIGNSSSAIFFGGLDGAGHTISNLRISYYGNYHGLFGINAAGSEIKNLSLASSCSILGDAETGSIVGRNNGNVQNCHSAASVYIGNAEAGGGLVGFNIGTITDCSFFGSVTRSGSSNNSNKLGGIAGVNETGAVITNCSSSCTIAGSLWNGGLVGWNNGTINRSFSKGSVNCNNNSNGGLVGQNQGAINNSYSRVNVTGAHYLGGLAGYHGGGSITNCYSTGTVSGGQKGGLIGASGGSVSNSYWDMQTSGISTSYGGTGKTTAQMKTQSTYVGWDFAGETANGTNNYWFFYDNWLNDGYPSLVMELAGGALPPIMISPENGAVNLPKAGFDFTWTTDILGSNFTSYILGVGRSPNIDDDWYLWNFYHITGATSYNPVAQDGLTFNYGETWYWTVLGYIGNQQYGELDRVRSFTIEQNPFPVTPAISSITMQGGFVTLTWNAVPNAMSYRIYASEAPDVALIPANLVSQVAGLTISLPTADSRRFYRITASSDSAPVKAGRILPKGHIISH